MPGDDAKNPCIKLCRFDADGLCLGCFRSRAEVKGWKRLDKATRVAINARVRPRMAAARPMDRKRLKRLKALDRKIAKLAARLDRAKEKRAALTDSP